MDTDFPFRNFARLWKAIIIFDYFFHFHFFSILAKNVINVMKQIFIKPLVDESWGIWKMFLPL
jgi:hypothetical protein